MYTLISFTANLKKETPENIIKLLEEMKNNSLHGDYKDLPEHCFFKTERWKMFFTSDSYYFSDKTNCFFYKDRITDSWFLEFKSNLKNYDEEIDKFIDWITPFINEPEGSFIGYKMYEEDKMPTLLKLN